MLWTIQTLFRMGKSILEFSMPFASTVFTNTSFSLSFSSQNQKLAPYSDSTQNLQQIWLLQHFMEVNTSRAICFLRFRHQISVPNNGVFLWIFGISTPTATWICKHVCKHHKFALDNLSTNSRNFCCSNYWIDWKRQIASSGSFAQWINEFFSGVNF